MYGITWSTNTFHRRAEGNREAQAGGTHYGFQWPEVFSIPWNTVSDEQVLTRNAERV